MAHEEAHLLLVRRVEVRGVDAGQVLREMDEVVAVALERRGADPGVLYGALELLGA